MGLDIFIWKEEVLTRNIEQRETVIKKTDVFQDKGWAIGEFLIESFDLNNGQTATIDLKDACEGVTSESQALSRNDADAINESYEESLTDLLTVLEKAKEDNANPANVYAEYSWALSW